MTGHWGTWNTPFWKKLVMYLGRSSVIAAPMAPRHRMSASRPRYFRRGEIRLYMEAGFMCMVSSWSLTVIAYLSVRNWFW